MFSKEKFTYDNIEELKQDVGLKIGNVVELNGYYTAGDGANHKRVIANEDDGSGVQLANGLWANVVHNGEVNVSWFGATRDNSTYTKNAFNIFRKIIRFSSLESLTLTIDRDNLWLTEDEPFTIFQDGEIPPEDYIKKNLCIKGIDSKTTITWSYSNENSCFVRVNSQFNSLKVYDLKIINFQQNYVSNDIAKGYLFYFNSVLKNGKYLGYTTMNEFKNVNSEAYGVGSGSLHSLKSVFYNIGYGQNDQTLVENCSFGHFKTVYYSTNPESVNWVFNKCGFSSIIKNSIYFYFESLFDNFIVKNSSFSLYGGINSTLLKTFHNQSDEKSYGSIFNIIFDSNRYEIYRDNGFIWDNLEFGKVTYSNSTNKLAGYTGNLDSYIKKDANIKYVNCSLRDIKFHLFPLEPINSGNLYPLKISIENSVIDDYDILLNSSAGEKSIHHFYERNSNTKYGIIRIKDSTYYNSYQKLNFDLNLTDGEHYDNIEISKTNFILGGKYILPLGYLIDEIEFENNLVPYSKIRIIFNKDTSEEFYEDVIINNLNTKRYKNKKLLNNKSIVNLAFKTFKTNTISLYYLDNENTLSGDIASGFKIYLKPINKYLHINYPTENKKVITYDTD